jgi:phosphohistidine phosphatase
VRVFLVRHASAAPGTPDEDRRLTVEGRAEALGLGQSLAAEGLDAVVSSPLCRARETATAVAEAAGLEASVDEGLAPGASLATLRGALAGYGETVVAVGHQPDCGNIFEELTGERRPFPTASFAELEL